MEYVEYENQLSASRRRVRENKIVTKRFLMKKIDWRDRLICIRGSRGTGKTTMLLQHIKEAFQDASDQALYVSLDHLWFETHALPELVELHYRSGGTHIFLDEVHYLKDWQRIIKNLYDEFPELHIVYTGSSLLKIDANGGDLSRRQITYMMPGLSFREYLYFEGLFQVEAVQLADLLENHVQIAEEITEQGRVLKAYMTYLEGGYYPFYREVFSGYEQRIRQIINQVLESDYPAVESISYTTVQKAKKMLYILAQSCPQTPNMSELYRELETDRNQGLKMLYTLDRVNLLNLLSAKEANFKNMSRPDKIFCENTNIMFALTEQINVGTKRETFFLNQLRSAGYEVRYPKQGDFLVDGRYLFEVGGRRKSFDQIKDLPDSFLAIDEEEVGRGNKIPLWMFGLLY